MSLLAGVFIKDLSPNTLEDTLDELENINTEQATIIASETGAPTSVTNYQTFFVGSGQFGAPTAGQLAAGIPAADHETLNLTVFATISNDGTFYENTDEWLLPASVGRVYCIETSFTDIIFTNDTDSVECSLWYRYDSSGTFTKWGAFSARPDFFSGNTDTITHRQKIYLYIPATEILHIVTSINYAPGALVQKPTVRGTIMLV